MATSKIQEKQVGNKEVLRFTAKNNQEGDLGFSDQGFTFDIDNNEVMYVDSNGLSIDTINTKSILQYDPNHMGDDELDVYIRETGSDSAGDGSEVNPYKTITGAFSQMPTNYGGFLNVFLDAAEYDGYELAAAINNVQNIVRIKGSIEVEETISSVTLKNTFNHSTTDTLVESAYKGKLLSLMYLPPSKSYITVPIVNNTTDTLYAPYLVLPTRNLDIINPTTTISFGGRVYGLNGLSIDNCNIKLGTADLYTTFTNCSKLEFNNSILYNEFPNTALLRLYYCNSIRFYNSAFKYTSNSSNKEALYIVYGNDVVVTGCSIINEDEDQDHQLIDAKLTDNLYVQNSCFLGGDSGLKLEGTLGTRVGGCYTEDCNKFIDLQDTGQINIYEDALANHQNYVLNNTAELISEGSATNQGRWISIPNANLTLDTGSISDELTNLTHNLLTNQYVRIGTGAMNIVTS